MSTGKAPADPAAPAVELLGLVKRYGQIAAVDGLSLTAARGEVTGILGPNGAGKTTTIEICEGYRRPDQGTVRVLGLDPVQDARALRPRVGVMLQSGGIPPSVPAADYLKLLSSFHVNPIEPTPVITTLFVLTPAAITVWTALPSGSKTAANSSGIAGSSFHTLYSGIAMNSANAPSQSTPMILTCSQMCA